VVVSKQKQVSMLVAWQGITFNQFYSRRLTVYFNFLNLTLTIYLMSLHTSTEQINFKLFGLT
jgi:hypothetical protein